MKAPDTIVIDGRAYSWRRILDIRRQRIEAWKAVQPKQPALFDVKEDCRPKAERTVAGRYREPTLLSVLSDAGG